MPTFYWVGNGCPKTGTPSTSHLYGTAEFSWNNPNNWIVAHSLHEVGMTGSASTSSSDSFKMKVEVYAIPDRVPGPGDTVYVGHYPWLSYANRIPDMPSTNGTISSNNKLFDSTQWDSLPSMETTIPKSPKATFPVLWKPYDYITGKYTPVSVPSGVAGTSGIPINKKFYATNSTTLGNTNYSNYSEWFEGTPLNISVINTETSRLSSYVKSMAAHRNAVRLGITTWSTWNNVGGLTLLPESALAPLLWGGCVAGTTGVTSASGISGGSGFTWWPNANTLINNSNPNIIAATGQALDELNIIMYSDNLPRYMGAYASNGKVTAMSAFWDPYPFKSVGDGLFGEEYNTVKNNITKPACLGYTGNGGYNGQDCYQCIAGLTGRASIYNSIFTNKSLTAEGVRATTLFVKANKVNIKTPHEWNKYGANNPLGEMIWNEDYAPKYRYNAEFTNSNISDATSWINKQLGAITCDGYTGCNETWGAWGNAGKNNADKYVELRLADNWGNRTDSTEYYTGTIVHAQMRFGQFNMPYGKVQELHLGIPHGSYGNEYCDGDMEIAGIPYGVSPSTDQIKGSLSNYLTYSNNDAMQLFNNTNFNNRDNTTSKFGKANPFWPSSGVYFVGSNNVTEASSRANIFNSYSVSATIFPTASLGVSTVFLNLGDNFEFAGKSLTAPAGSYDYTKDLGSVTVNHGYPIVVGNNRSNTIGIFQHGSTVTGDAFRSALITAKSIGKVSNDGTTGQVVSQGSTKPKTAFVTSILNSQIGDMIVDNTDYIFLSPEQLPISSTQKYGNKVIDRMFVKDNSNVDISRDTHGYIHFGRILNASSGYTGSIYGGVIFQGDNNQVFYPAAGTRLWISALGGNITDNRQQSMPVAFVANNNLPGTGEMPSALVGSTVSQTSPINNKAYNVNEIAAAKNPDYIDLNPDGFLGNAEEEPPAQYEP